MNEHYTAEFFSGQSRGSLTSARAILGELFAYLRPARIIDVGCGIGTWLLAARELGAREVVGVDGDYVDRTALLISPREFLAVDLENERLRDVPGLGTGPRFDLVISVEVAEHLSFARARSFVDDLTGLGDAILFSAAVPFQGGVHHVNEQWPEFWALLFRSHRFRCLDPVRLRVWNSSDVDWWYSQNTLVFVREGSQAMSALPQPGEPAVAPLAVIHPDNYLSQVLYWFHSYREAAAKEEFADLAALVSAYRAGSDALPALQALARAAAEPNRADIFPRTRSERCRPEELLRERQVRLEEAERERDEIREALWRSEALCESLQTGLADLRIANTGLIAANDGLDRARTSLKEMHDRLSAANAELKTHQEVLEAAHAELREEYGSLKREMECRLEEVQDAVRAAAAASRQELESRERALEASNSELLACRCDIARREDDLASLKGELNSLKRDLQSEQQKTSVYETELLSCKQKHESIEQELALCHRGRVSLEENVESCGRELAELRRRLARLEGSRAVRVARWYYSLYSRPLLGLPLRAVRGLGARFLRHG